MEELLKIVETWQPKDIKQKRYAGQPDLSKLLGDQPAAFEALRNFMNSSEQNLFTLEGNAGSGKTVLINVFIEHCLSRKGAMKIAMAATTNKAYKQLVKLAEYKHTNLVYSTVHSLLGLKEVIKDDGTIAFEPEFKKPEDKKLVEFHLLVVDEVSMLNDKIFYYLLPYLEKGLKIIFIGDGAQIPPVRDAEEKKNLRGLYLSIPLDEVERKDYNIGYFKMEQILRQALDNPIIQTATKIRENLINRRFILNGGTNMLESGHGVYFINSEEDDLFTLLEKYYCSEKFNLSNDFVRTIAWTNKTVDRMNVEIRSMLFGDNLPKVVIGDRLIADKPIIDAINGNEEIIFTTNDEFTVKNIYEDKVEIDETELKFYATDVEYLNQEGGIEVKRIKVLHEDSQHNFDKLSKARMLMAKGEPRGSQATKMCWKLYWDLQKFFAQIKYQYCSTIHRAQGSTFGICVVLLRNIMRNPDYEERNHILYTACTRPSDLLIVVK